jgi:hypothetical protein
MYVYLYVHSTLQEMKAARVWMLVMLWINFFQLCGLLMIDVDTIPWPYDWFSEILNVFTLDIDISPPAFVGGFWGVAALYALLGARALWRWLYGRIKSTSFKTPRWELTIRDVMLTTLFIPTAKVFFGMLSCGDTPDVGASVPKVRHAHSMCVGGSVCEC